MVARGSFTDKKLPRKRQDTILFNGRPTHWTSCDLIHYYQCYFQRISIIFKCYYHQVLLPSCCHHLSRLKPLPFTLHTELTCHHDFCGVKDRCQREGGQNAEENQLQETLRERSGIATGMAPQSAKWPLQTSTNNKWPLQTHKY